MSAPEVQQYEVLDDQAHKTGQLLDATEVHNRELWHEVVNVWIMNSADQVLLQLRGPAMELNPNLWDAAIGTHVRPGEEPAASAVRCLQTELGIACTADNLKHLFNIQTANPLGNGKTHRVLGHVFLLRRDMATSDLKVDPSKVAQLKWLPLGSLVAEVGNPESAAAYLPRAGGYYSQLFDQLLAESGMR